MPTRSKAIFPSAVSRRQFLSAAALSPLAIRAQQNPPQPPSIAGSTTQHPEALTQSPAKIPVGLELYSVRNAMNQDLTGTVKKIAALGYDDVEFYAPYYAWSEEQVKSMRKLLDDLGIRCLSTHNSYANFSFPNIQKAIDYNKILGCAFVIVDSAPAATTTDDWKKVADTMALGAARLVPVGLRGGFHNHKAELVPVSGELPIDIILKGTSRSFMLQLDIGNCLEAGADPVAIIKSHAGRINSIHLKDWSKDKGFKATLGEGSTPWKEILAAAESGGGVEFYVVEQEESDSPEMDTAQKNLAAYRKFRMPS